MYSIYGEINIMISRIGCDGFCGACGLTPCYYYVQCVSKKSDRYDSYDI